MSSAVVENLATAIRAQHAAARRYDAAAAELQAATRRGASRKRLEALRVASNTARAAWLERFNERREATHLFDLAALVQPPRRSRRRRSAQVEIPT